MAAPQQGNTNLQDAAGDVLNIKADGTMPVEGGITPGDALALAGQVAAVREEQSGTGVTSIVRIATKFIQLKAQAITAGTPVSVYTATTGKKWRILGYHISLSVAGSILFEDLTGVEVLRTPLLAAGAGQGSGNMGLGVQAAAVSTAMFLDVTASGNVSGWIAIEEE